MYAQLTPQGKRRLAIFIGLCCCSAVGLIFYVKNAQEIEPGLLIVFLLPAPIYYYAIKASLHKRLVDLGFGHIGFKTDSSLGISGEYQVLKRGSKRIGDIRTGTLDNQNFKVINFSISVGSGKNKKTYPFIGVEFETVQHHLAVQIYDKANPLKPFLGGINLESNEFNRIYRVYSEEDKSAFYQLDPDTMEDLIKLRKEWKISINIESFSNCILIYVNAGVLENMLSKILNFSDVFNGEVGPEKITSYQIKILEFIGKLIKIFAALDFKLKDTRLGGT